MDKGTPVLGWELFLAGVNSLALAPAVFTGSMVFCSSGTSLPTQKHRCWQRHLAGVHGNVRDMGGALTETARPIRKGLVKMFYNT